MPYWGQMSGFGFIFFPIMMIIVFVIFMFVMRMFGMGMGCSSHGEHKDVAIEKAPLDILEERFAKGEIDANEFQDKKRLLSK